MMSLLRRADFFFVADDLHAIFAEAAIHRRFARNAFGGAFEKCVRDVLVNAEVLALEDFDVGPAKRECIGRRENSSHQNSGEKKKRRDDDARETKARRKLEAVRHQWLGGTGITDE